jgi:hypothetical protein
MSYYEGPYVRWFLLVLLLIMIGSIIMYMMHIPQHFFSTYYLQVGSSWPTATSLILTLHWSRPHVETEKTTTTALQEWFRTTIEKTDILVHLEKKHYRPLLERLSVYLNQHLSKIRPLGIAWELNWQDGTDQVESNMVYIEGSIPYVTHTPRPIA